MARLAAVTGASAGIGMSYAERLAADGWDLLVTGRRAERLEDLRDRLGGVNVTPVPMDHGDERANAELAERLAAEPDLELLVNNAGVAHYKPFVDLPVKEAIEILSVHVE